MLYDDLPVKTQTFLRETMNLAPDEVNHFFKTKAEVEQMVKIMTEVPKVAASPAGDGDDEAEEELKVEVSESQLSAMRTSKHFRTQQKFKPEAQVSSDEIKSAQDLLKSLSEMSDEDDDE